jgi:hypothetical protein
MYMYKPVEGASETERGRGRGRGGGRGRGRGRGRERETVRYSCSAAMKNEPSRIYTDGIYVETVKASGAAAYPGGRTRE